MAKQDPLDLYLDALSQVRATGAGTDETSYYPAIAKLLDHVGATLKPTVFCLHHVSGKKSGIPDFGLFEKSQFRRGDQPQWTTSTPPPRGVIEVKGAGHSIATLIASDQIRVKYLPSFGLVLAMNLWQFRLLSSQGIIETFDLADSEAAFWKLVHGSRPNPLRTRFKDFLQRCLLTNAPLARPADIAFFLASYARDALARLAEHADLPALANLRRGMEATLGLQFDARDGEHLFRSTLVQTLFYGLFSAWIVDARAGKPAPFNWRGAQWSMNVPVADFLFQQIATPQALGPFEIVPLLDAAARTLDRVVRPAFFTAFNETEAVQYFYEPFLKFFDSDLRKQLGVWYTPPEIVTYMVERVDRVLRTELGLEDGLADPNVWVLDPCCGTGSFVVAVLDRIRRTLEGKGIGALVASQLKQAATTRVVGFEIMTAPFVIAHWQIGQELLRAGAPLLGQERASVYLTNALTGWSVGEAGAVMPGFDPLMQERISASAVKQEKPILVVLGNPPYNAYAGTSPESEGGLVDAYKVGLQTDWNIRKFNLDDLYVRFFRIAERKITEGRGIIAYISNYSWLSGQSYVVMRQRLTSEFDRMWIENMHGDRKITEYGPDGRSSETVFAVQGFSPGIRQGVATALLLRTGQGKPPIYRFRNDINASKAAERRGELLATLKDADFNDRYEILSPTRSNRFLLSPGMPAADYATWAALPDLAKQEPLNGLMEKRGGALMDADRAVLEARMRVYLDYPKQDMSAVRAVAPGLATDHAAFDAIAARRIVSQRENFKDHLLKRYCIRPFDVCWAYTTAVPLVWNRPRPKLQHALPDAQGFLASRVRGIAEPEGFPATWTPLLIDDHALRADAFVFPIMENQSGAARPNLSDKACQWLTELAVDINADSARLVWMHALAITYSPAWLSENDEGIRQGWPRIPLPDSAERLKASAALGEKIAGLLDPDTPVPGVTSGNIRPEFAILAVPATTEGQPPNWRVTAGWGNRTDKRIVMPGRGRLDTRPYGSTEGPAKSHAALLGNQTHDIWLNGTTFWRNVPTEIWQTHIGGYQVLKKWLSYREASVLGRAMTADEVTHVMHTARRLAAIRLLGPDLDTSFRACAAAHKALA